MRFLLYDDDRGQLVQVFETPFIAPGRFEYTLEIPMTLAVTRDTDPDDWVSMATFLMEFEPIMKGRDVLYWSGHVAGAQILQDIKRLYYRANRNSYPATDMVNTITLASPEAIRLLALAFKRPGR